MLCCHITLKLSCKGVKYEATGKQSPFLNSLVGCSASLDGRSGSHLGIRRRGAGREALEYRARVLSRSRSNRE